MTSDPIGDLASGSDEDIIAEMAAVMADSIAKLLKPCVEQRCKQFLTLLHEQEAFGPPKRYDRGFQRNENNEGDTVIV